MSEGLSEFAASVVIRTKEVRRLLAAFTLSKFIKATDSLWFKIYRGQVGRHGGRR